MKKLYQKILSGFLVFAMLLTLVPPIAVHAAEELQLPDKIALSTIFGQEVNETNATVADSVYSAETSISVNNEITSVAVSDFETEDKNAKVYFYGTNSSEDAQEDSGAVEIEAGKTTTVYVKVIASDDSASSKYTIKINRAEEENGDVNSNDLPDKVELKTVLGKTPKIDNKMYIPPQKMYMVYTSLSVESEVKSISPSDLASIDENATIRFLGANGDAEEAVTEPVNLEAGKDTKVYLRVDAADGSLASMYIITISREEEKENVDTNSNDLPDKVELETVLGQKPTTTVLGYSKDDKAYTVQATLTVGCEVASISTSDLVCMDKSSKTSIVDMGSEKDNIITTPVDLKAGETTIVYAMVAGENESVRSMYIININRAKGEEGDSNSNGLPDKVELKRVLGKMPKIDNKMYIAPQKMYMVYTSLSVDSEVKSISPSDLVSVDENATIRFLGADSEAEEAVTEPVNLEAGKDTNVYLRIDAADGSLASMYIITISRAKEENGDANSNGILDKVELKTILGKIPTINSQESISGGKVHKIEASVTVNSKAKAIALKDFVSLDENATIRFLGTDEYGDPITEEVNLKADGATKVYVKVYAADGSKGIYTITISKDKVKTVEITGFETIKLYGGTTDNTVYEDVYNHLKENYSNILIPNTNGTVSVTKWNNTDNCTPNIAGEYTFTAELGDLPEGYILSEGVTATAEVSIYDKTQSAGIKDTVLQEKLCTILGVEKDHDITVGDMMRLEGMLDLARHDYDDDSIQDYSGLRHAQNITGLNLRWNMMPSSDDCADRLSDLSYLTNLESLEISRSNLTALPDMTNMTKLKMLDIGYYNKLTYLPNMTNMSKLEYLDVEGNSLTDLSQLEGLINLKSLDISDCNLNSLLDLSGLVNLEDLSINDNNITTLSGSGIEKLSSLTKFNASGNQLTTIDLSKLKNLTDLQLGENKFTSLTVKDLPELKYLNLDVNDLTDIILVGLPKLNRINLGHNKFETMPDISSFTELIDINISRNKLTDITGDFSKLTKLKDINAMKNQLTSISEDICSIKALKTLNVGYNKISSIDENISKLTALKTLILEENDFTSWPDSINNMSSLSTLDLSNNKISKLPENLSGLTNLNSLHLDSNRFETLHDSIGDLAKLTSLNISGNNLKTLPASLGKLTILKSVDMSFNKFSKFPSCISRLTALEAIKLNNNLLTDIDIDSEGNTVDLSNLTNVISVNLDFNHIDKMPECMKTLPNLNELKMQCNYIPNIPKDYLKDMKNLDKFIIYYSYIDWDNDAISKKEITDFLAAGHSAQQYDVHGLYATLKAIDTSVGSIELKDARVNSYSHNLKAPAGTTSIIITPNGANSKTKIAMGDNHINSGESFTVNNLKVGVNEITLVATNEIDNSKITYKITLSIPEEGAKELDPDHLPDGTYGVDIDAMKERENAASMTNQFITEAAKLDVKDGKMILTMVWNGNDAIKMTQLEGMWYNDKNGEYVELIIPDDNPDTNKYTYSDNVIHNAEKDSLTITLPVESITKDTYLKVYAPTGMEETRPILRLVFNTDTLVDLSTGGVVKTIDLENIVLDTTNVKKEYTVGEELDVSGLVVTGNYNDGSKKILTVIEANVTGFDSFKAVEKQTLTVKVNGASATYDISIKKRQIDKENLKDGEYTISAKAQHYYDPNQLSMADQFIKKPATIKVKDGKISVSMLWESTNVSLSSLKELKHRNSNGDFVDTTRTYDAKNDTVTVEFDVEGIKDQKIFQVYVPKEMGETRQKFKLVFDLDTLKLVKEDEEEHLKDGEYSISAAAQHYYDPNEFSMANQFIKKPATLKVKDGKISVSMLWESTNVSLSSLKELKHRNSNGDFVDTTRTYDAQNDTVTVEFDVEDLKKPKIFQVYVPKEMGETRQKFKLVFDFDTLKLVKAYEKDRDEVIEKLQEVINTQIDQTKKYTKESYKAYENALKAAKEINKKIATATVQEIDQATKVLKDAIAGLEERVEVTIDKDHLDKKIEGINAKKKKIVLNEISEELAKKARVNISIGDVEDAKVEVPVKPNAQGKREAILPKLEITSNHGNVTMPAGIKVTGDENWDGKIKIPTTVENEDISNIKGTPKMAISLGVDDKTLTFDQPVKIVFPNQAGKKIAFITKRGDQPKEITHTLLATQNNAEAVGKAMKDAHVEEAKLDEGKDLVIWTTHFTTFIVYEESDDSGTTGGTKDKFLTNGTHRIKAWAKHFYENGKSMAEQFIKRATNLEVQDEDVTVRMVWDSTNISLSKLKEFKYENSHGELVNARRTYDSVNDTLEIELKVKKEAIKEGITCQVYVPDGMGETRQKFKLMFDLGSLDNVKEILKETEKVGNGSYEADIKILKENEDKASIIEPYFLKKADVKVESDKNYVRLFIKNKEDIKDLKVEVNGNDVKYETKMIKEYDNDKKANMIKFEIPKLDASMKLKAKIVPEDNKEVTFRVVLDQDQFKKKTDDSIEVYINLLEGKVIKAVDLSKNGLYEMTMEVKEKDKNLVAMVQKYLVNEVNYEVIKGKNYVQVMLKNADEIKDLKVYVNSMGVEYEKIKNNERNTVIRFEVPNADAKIRFSICMSEEKEEYTGFDIALKKNKAKEIQEKIYLYIQSPEIVDMKKGSIQNIQLDVAPLIEENRTLVPLRGICETLGAKVKWQAATRSILLSDGEMKIELEVDKRVAKVSEEIPAQACFAESHVDKKATKVNGKTIKMDVAPKIINNRTFVPIRFISENLKHEVKWIKEEQKIVITKKLNMVEEKDTNKKENKEKRKSNKQKQFL
ncbi:NEAT domain-containing protein [Crassaminicella profunda]|uniref:NEAT domain-containing protein n=1 Tax=Crassaminicella profunda TaxID=1286698 RepID=UPI001CA778B2|nr:NEAT domain-containing protein [Crassaminicella profunda]QZY55873.1 NEAT domain-containing protein [Crassaminicella profunda]